MIDTIDFLKLHPAAKLPNRGSKQAAGLDIYSVENVTIPSGKRVSVRTGLAVGMPGGFYGRVAPRSGLAIRYGIDVLAGVIDSDYRGEIICVLINHGEMPFHIEIGQRIAQLLIEPIVTPHPQWADELEKTERGTGGFGSTGTA